MPANNDDRFLLLVRHSAVHMEKQKPAKEWSLSPEGRERCRQFAPLIAPFRPDLFITSREKKAIETGVLLANALDIPIQRSQNLHEQERSNVPIYADPQDFRNKIAHLFAAPDQLVFGQETATQAAERFDTAVCQLIEQHRDKNLAIVAHGTVMTLFVNRYNPAIEPKIFWNRLKQPCAVLLRMPDMALEELILL